jgi:hypothetical protein
MVEVYRYAQTLRQAHKFIVLSVYLHTMHYHIVNA